jgi:hypothetical protein
VTYIIRWFINRISYIIYHYDLLLMTLEDLSHLMCNARHDGDTLWGCRVVVMVMRVMVIMISDDDTVI